jgi:hypothetical protein
MWVIHTQYLYACAYCIVVSTQQKHSISGEEVELISWRYPIHGINHWLYTSTDSYVTTCRSQWQTVFDPLKDLYRGFEPHSRHGSLCFFCLVWAAALWLAVPPSKEPYSLSIIFRISQSILNQNRSESINRRGGRRRRNMFWLPDRKFAWDLHERHS